ncbi:MAG: hypothetical protein IT179_13685 [Acidobacteria bacterium]|nr:hypothetical protein [Acidobacteriota bacterium]
MTSITLRVGARDVAARLDSNGHVHVDGRGYRVTAVSPGIYLVADGGQRWRVAVAEAGGARWVAVDGQVAVIELGGASSRSSGRRSGHAGAMAAPMPATVVKILVAPGQEIAEGATVLVLEAMKMELPIRAPRAGVVKAVRCAQGELVQPGVSLVELE